MSLKHIMWWHRNLSLKIIFLWNLVSKPCSGFKVTDRLKASDANVFSPTSAKTAPHSSKIAESSDICGKNKIKIKFLRPNTGALQLTNHALKIVIAIFAIKPFGLPPQNKKTHYEIFRFYFCERIFEQFNWVSLALLERKWKRRVYHWPLQVQTFLLSWYN